MKIDERDWPERSRELAGLLARAGLGDRAAFARLYEGTSGHLCAVVLRIQRDSATVLPKDLLPGGLKGSQLDHLAVSVEPPGGSPTGQPTGPVVFYGKL